MSINIPAEVISYVRSVFRNVNQTVSQRICAMPTIHEESLDMALIDAVSSHAYPVQVIGDWIVRMETHFLGGMRHWMHRWEIADIGILFMVRRGGRLTLTKSALLQSKRLYPNEQDTEENEPADFQIGFARLFHDDLGTVNLQPRTFTLDEESRYKALDVLGDQHSRIYGFSQSHPHPVYYLFYNPSTLPWSVTLPASPSPAVPTELAVGARVVPFSQVYTAFRNWTGSRHPSFRELKTSLPPPFDAGCGWALESFIADELMACREGYRITNRPEEALNSLFYRRSGPIASAFTITIDGPAGGTSPD